MQNIFLCHLKENMNRHCNEKRKKVKGNLDFSFGNFPKAVCVMQSSPAMLCSRFARIFVRLDIVQKELTIQKYIKIDYIMRQIQ